MKYLFALMVFLGFTYWLMHAGLLPPKLVPSPLLEYMAEKEQRQITEIRNEMRVLQKELNALHNAEKHATGDITGGPAQRTETGDLKISLDDIIKSDTTSANISAEEKRFREQLQELSLKLDQHRNKLIWCQRGLVP